MKTYMIILISYLILLLALILSSCVEKSNVKTKNTTPTIKDNGYYGLKIINLEGCEYYLLPLHGSYTMCHKGNCINHIHYKNK